MGFFISLEGIDGCGKTTQWQLLQDRYAVQSDPRWLFTKNPGGTELGLQLRQLLLAGKEANLGEISEEAELLIYLADRAQQVKQLLRPALQVGQVVVCDRFADSTLAYQGYGRGLSLGRIRQLNDFATDGLQPDLTFFLDIPPELALERGIGRDRIERLGLAFFQRVREGFWALAAAEPQRIQRIEASGCTPQEIHQQIIDRIQRCLG